VHDVASPIVNTQAEVDGQLEDGRALGTNGLGPGKRAYRTSEIGAIPMSGYPTYQALAAPREDQGHFLGVIRYRIAVGFRAGILKRGTTDEAISTPI